MKLEVSLSRKGWHYTLQGFVLGKDNRPELHSLCPYFWLTNFCILVLPFVVPLRLFQYMGRMIEKYLTAPAFERYIDKVMDKILPAHLYAIESRNFGYVPLSLPWWAPGTRSDRFSQISKRWREKKKIDDKKWEDIVWERGYDAYLRLKQENNRKMVEEFEREEEEKRKKRQERKKSMARFTPIIIWTKRIVTVLFSLLLLGAVVLIGWWLYHLFAKIDLSVFLHVVAFLALIIGGGIVFGWLLKVLCAMYNQYKESKKPAIEKGPGLVRRVFLFIWQGITGFFRFFIDYFKAAKNNYCPAINWKEDEER